MSWMATGWRSSYWKLLSATSLAISGTLIAFCGDYTRAQIVPDGTLGAESSIVTPNVIIKDVPSDQIEGGAIRGAHLFHSFSEFNVGEGRGAYFANPDGIENIFSRVTGGSRSDILGTLGVLGGANLFLINPNGIMFGENASLDVRGSFVGTTANGIRFGDGFFSATAPNLPSQLLTVNPSALFFNAVSTQGEIVNLSRASDLSGETNISGGSVGLQVPNGQTLALVGGNLLLDDGNLTAKKGRIELGSVRGVGEVRLSQSDNNWMLEYNSIDLFGDIQLENTAVVDTSGEGGGNIQLRSAQLLMSESFVYADTSGAENGGDVFIGTTEAVTLTDGSIIASNVSGSGNAGNLTIETGQLSVTDGAQVSVSTFGEGDAGSLLVQAHSIELTGIDAEGVASGLFAQVNPDATGTGGNLTIRTAQLSVRGGAEVSVSVRGQGDAGQLSVQANSIELSGTDAEGDASGLFADVAEATGTGGNLTIETGQLSVKDGAQVSVSTSGEGDAGSLLVQANSIELIGTNAERFSTGLFAGVDSEATGTGGDLTIKTGQLSLRDEVAVSVATLGEGDAGQLSVQADSVSLANSSLITSQVVPGAVGNAGNIKIQTRSLTLVNGSQVNTVVRGSEEDLPGGQGEGGDIQIEAADFVELSGVDADGFSSGLFAVTQQGAVGRAGDITVNTGAFRVADGAVVNTQTQNLSNGGDIAINAKTFEATGGGQVLSVTRDQGRAGEITLNVTDSVILSGSDPTFTERFNQFGRFIVLNEGPASGLFANTSEESTGLGGDLEIAAGQLIVQNGAQITASSQGAGDAGDLTISTEQMRVENGAEVSASTRSGVGGDITLVGLNSLQVSNGSRISTSTQTGQAGSLSVNATDSVQLDGNGSELSARATAGGNAGSLTINTSQLTVADGAEATVSSPQGQAGSLTVTANSLRLDQGNLTAVTGKDQGEGGANVNLQVQDLLLMGNESQISADALGTANGGNINIDTDFLIALPPQGENGSDIAANAFEGNGGRLNITAQGILGTEFRPSETQLNDITASSEFGSAGVVTLTTPDVDLQNSLIELAANFVSPDYVVAGSCLARRNVERGSFTVTGTGGLPSSPYEAMSGRYVVAGVQPIQGNGHAANAANMAQTTPWGLGNPVQEAQGMTVTAEGRIILGTAPQLVAVAKAKDLIC